MPQGKRGADPASTDPSNHSVLSGAAENPPDWPRVFWAVCGGGVATVMSIAGGLQALQTAANRERAAIRCGNGVHRAE